MGLSCIDGLANSGLLGHILALKEQKSRSAGRGVARRRLLFSSNTSSSSSSSENSNTNDNYSSTSTSSTSISQRNIRFANQQLEALAQEDAERWNFNFTSMRPKEVVEEDDAARREGERGCVGGRYYSWRPVEDTHTAPLYYTASSYPCSSNAYNNNLPGSSSFSHPCSSVHSFACCAHCITQPSSSSSFISSSLASTCHLSTTNLPTTSSAATSISCSCRPTAVATIDYANANDDLISAANISSSSTTTTSADTPDDTLSNITTTTAVGNTPDTLTSTSYNPPVISYTITPSSATITTVSDGTTNNLIATKSKRDSKHQVKRLRQTICTDYFKKTRSAKPHFAASLPKPTGGVAEREEEEWSLREEFD